MNVVAQPAPQPALVERQRSKPLLPVRGVMSLVDKNEDQVLRLIDDGQLAWAFDVALDPKRGRNLELRILPAAVSAYLRGQTCELEWADVLRLLLPHDEPVIFSTDITRILNVCGSHTYHLASRKLITSCSTHRRWRGGRGHFTTKSFINFLKERRVL